MNRIPFWLNNREIQAIDLALSANQTIKALNHSQQQKVAALLYSIAYADKWAMRRTSWITKWMHKLIYGENVVQKQLLSGRSVKQVHNTNGLPQVIDKLVSQIKTETPPQAIFATFHRTPPQSNYPLKKISTFFRKPEELLHYINDSLEAYSYVLNEH